MSLSITQDFLSSDDWEQRPREVLQQVHKTGRPLVITVEGKPDVVMLDAATYERRLKLINLSHLLREAELDVQAGRTRPIKAFWKEFQRAKKVSR